MVFYDNRKKNYASSPPVDEQFVNRKIAQPLPQISNGPSLILSSDCPIKINSFLGLEQN
jgi:hypothetical protein